MPVVDESPIIWIPNKGGQWLFLACPFWEALATGDRGGGKTTTLLMTFLAHVGKGYGTDWRGILFRLSYPQLKDVIDMSRILIPQSFPGAKYKAGEERLWEFETGEVLMFRHLENLKAYDNYHGHAYPWLGFEELTNWATPEPYEAMLSCSRWRSARPGVPRMVRSTTNAFGVGHSWVKQRFVTGKQPNKPYGEDGRQRIRIQILWEENRSYVEADPDYHIRLAESISNEAQVKAWTEDSWDIVAGGRFSDVWKESVHVVAPFQIPKRWYIDRSHDWGSTKPFCTLWFAESNGEALPDGRSWPRGTLFVIHEDYGCYGNVTDANFKPNVGLRLPPGAIADRVVAEEERMKAWGLIETEPMPGPADDPIFDVSRGTSMASFMSAKGVVWNRPSKGPGSRITGWQIIEDKLNASMAHPMEEPGIFIFNTCTHLLRTLPALPRDAKKQDDIDTNTEDHAVDALRLRCLSYGHSDIVHELGL